MKQHCQNVICSVEDYLKHIISIYTEQRQIRIRRALDKCKVSKLETFCNQTSNSQLNNDLRKRNRVRKDSLNILEDEESNDEQFDKEDHQLTQHYEDEEHLLDILTPEELQIFEQENDQLFNELNALTDEVK